MTSYNHSEYLKQRMESLLRQTYTPIEIIVIDDCSTDESATVLEEYGCIPNIRVVILKENGGYVNACNLGVKLCNGKYIMFAECDDYDEPEHIEVLMKGMLDNKTAGVAYCRSNVVDSEGKMLGNDFECREKSFKKVCSRDTLISREMIQKFLLISCVVPNMSAAIIRKECFDMVGGLDSRYKACADWDFWCRVAEYHAFYYVARPLNYFRTHSETVRKKASVALQVGEYYDLLYRSFARMNLKLSDGVRFRINLGFVWANFIITNPFDWFRSLPTVWRRSVRHDKMSAFYMILGLIVKSVRVIQRRI